MLSTLLVAFQPAHAQSEIVLYNFCSQPNCTDGENPASSLMPDGAGNFYSTTQMGGALDLKFSLQTVNCLGCCALGPVIEVDGKTHGKMAPSKAVEVLKNYE